MINQDYIMRKTPCLNECVAYTDVSVLKYDKHTFNLILDQFQDFKEDLQEATEDKTANELNNQFIHEAINGDEVRKIIAENYHEVIKEEGIRVNANRKSLALKINQDIERLTKGPPPLRNSAKKKSELDNGQARTGAAASMKYLN